MRRLVFAGMLLFALGCRSSQGDPQATPLAEFGVRFGGDIQDRSTIPLELDPSRQELGLRVTFPAPLSRDARVSWEVEKPTARRGVDGGTLYAAELGERLAHPGERRLESSFAFRRGDPLGTWRVKIRVDGRVILDRRFEVVDPRRSDAGVN